MAQTKFSELHPLERKYIRTTALWMLGLMAAACLSLTVLTPFLCAPADVEICMGMGAILMALAVPLHILAGTRKLPNANGRRWLYVPAMLLNLLGVAFFESVYYTHIQVIPPNGELAAGAVMPVALCLLILAAVWFFPARLHIVLLLGGLLDVAGIVTCVVFWVKAGLTADSVLWSFALFNLVGILIALVTLIYAASEVSELFEASDAEPTEHDEKKAAWGWMRFLSFASFGLFMIVGAVVLLALMATAGDCDCDCGDCCDCGGSGSDTPSTGKKKRPKQL